jgi:sugar O-acyltransferase (sialic acid O-acetyltransferase NeuD family)
MGVLGAGAYAREIAEVVQDAIVKFFAVDREFLEPNRSDLVDISTTERSLVESMVVAGVGAPGLRRQLVEAWGGRRFVSVVARSAWVSPSAAIGAGCVLMPHAAVSTGAVLGAHVSLNIGATVSHDCTLGDFVTLSPGVHVAGGCVVGTGAFVGVGATISNGVSIAPGAIIGAGAVVVKDITVAGVYAGVPSRRLRDHDGWLREL